MHRIYVSNDDQRPQRWLQSHDNKGRVDATRDISSHRRATSKMPMDFATFVVQLNDAIVFENGPNLAYLLRPTSPHGKDLVKEFRNPTVRPPRQS